MTTELFIEWLRAAAEHTPNVPIYAHMTSEDEQGKPTTVIFQLSTPFKIMELRNPDTGVSVRCLSILIEPDVEVPFIDGRPDGSPHTQN